MAPKLTIGESGCLFISFDGNEEEAIKFAKRMFTSLTYKSEIPNFLADLKANGQAETDTVRSPHSDQLLYITLVFDEITIGPGSGANDNVSLEMKRFIEEQIL